MRLGLHMPFKSLCVLAGGYLSDTISYTFTLAQYSPDVLASLLH